MQESMSYDGAFRRDRAALLQFAGTLSMISWQLGTSLATDAVELSSEAHTPVSD